VKRSLSDPRPLVELGPEASGQLATEWMLVAVVIVLPLMLLVPTLIEMISIYFYRVAEVICLPFP
jgi:hypothetical protein